MHKFIPGIGVVVLLMMLWQSCDSHKDEAEATKYNQEIMDYRSSNYADITDSATSRFNAEERQAFIDKAPGYFAPDINYRVEAAFVLDTSYPVFQMPTTTDRKPNYRIYGFLHFVLRDTACTLTVYQNYDYKDHPEHGGYLFIPFRDQTSEFSTYGGGRYLDIPIPEGKTATLDFNKAYNPLCAYSERWSCPLVPMNNALNVAILAGEKKYK